MPRKVRATVDRFKKLAPPVEVNGTAYNRVIYSIESGTIILALEKGGHLGAVFDTTLFELSCHYGLRTAVRVRTALLKVYGNVIAGTF